MPFLTISSSPTPLPLTAFFRALLVSAMDLQRPFAWSPCILSHTLSFQTKISQLIFNISFFSPINQVTVSNTSSTSKVNIKQQKINPHLTTVPPSSTVHRAFGDRSEWAWNAAGYPSRLEYYYQDRRHTKTGICSYQLSFSCASSNNSWSQLNPYFLFLLCVPAALWLRRPLAPT